MKVALFITCFNDTLFPGVGIATTHVLERLGLTLDFPEAQTCCGQMHFNTGYQRESIPLVRHFVEVFRDAEVVVALSASCVGMVRELYSRAAVLSDDETLIEGVEQLIPRIYELSEFLVKRLGATDIGAYYPHRVTYRRRAASPKGWRGNRPPNRNPGEHGKRGRVMATRSLPSFPQTARVALANSQLRRNLGRATTTIRNKRAAGVSELPDWEALRTAGSAIKAHVMRHLDEYLLQLEALVQRAGVRVHWARDAAEGNRIITEFVQRTGADRVVKVKSLTTDETRLNQALTAAGIRAIEIDLAELIIQLAGETCSHILVPAIHKNRSEIRDLFRQIISRGQDLTDDPRRLAAAARRYLREQFLSAQVAISGANFAIAETETVCVVESEGNGRMCVALPQTLITVMGIEKILPTFQDFAVFLQLLPRSSTGERMNPYTSLWTGVTPGDGPHTFES